MKVFVEYGQSYAMAASIIGSDKLFYYKAWHVIKGVIIKL
jgi:hypothetical protein